MVFGCFFHVFGTKAGVPHVGGEIVKISQKGSGWFILWIIVVPLQP
jgi:hypothetical protein